MTGEPVVYVGASKDPLPADPSAERTRKIEALLARIDKLEREATSARTVQSHAQDRLHRIGRALYTTRVERGELVDRR